MRFVQYRLLKFLEKTLPIPEYCWAFEPGKKIPDMAKLHVNKHVVISLDLKDFFTHIKENKVREFLIADGFGESAARLVSELCTYKSFVPQGALTSPKISNYVTSKTFGPELYEYCSSNNLTLTVYADDITISSDVAVDIKAIIKFVVETVNKHGFKISYKKTKVMGKSSRQYVCGAVVNEKVNFLKSEKIKMRALLYGIEKFGLEKCAETYGARSPEHYLQILRGKLSWWKSLNEKGSMKFISRWNSILKDFQAKEELNSEVEPEVVV